jgi:hypothetical protein
MSHLEAVAVPDNYLPSRSLLEDPRWQKSPMLLTGFQAPYEYGYHTYAAIREVDERGKPTALTLEWHGARFPKRFGPYAYCGWARYERAETLGGWIIATADNEHSRTSLVTAAYITDLMANWRSMTRWNPASSVGRDALLAFRRVDLEGHAYSRAVAARLGTIRSLYGC